MNAFRVADQDVDRPRLRAADEVRWRPANLRPERFLPSSDEVAREASTEATGELVTRAHSDTALAQLKSRLA